ncbi:uncharacterized protein LOC133905827 [Phragmites australis]|uniref:uncharacterized protein LOC133905827 n=1 Tax=Phragmites australis TaxID=29695 RepID=UPI002D794D40|nr:uncharacterized protein LOC133905827 [Phragmites australis]
MEVHCSRLESYGAAAGQPVLFCPAPQMPVPAVGPPHLPPPYEAQVELRILVHEIVDPITSTFGGPLFSGPPPERPENPMIHDPLFGKALPTASFVATARSPRSTWTLTFDSGIFCGAPPVV